jgi:hypothetical protein
MGSYARVLEQPMVDVLARTVGFIDSADPTDSNHAGRSYMHITRTAHQGQIDVWRLQAGDLDRTHVAQFTFNLLTGDLNYRPSQVVLPARTGYEMGPILILYEFENTFQIIYYASGQENLLMTSTTQRPLIRSINEQWFSVLTPNLHRQSQTVFFNRKTLTQTRPFSNLLLANYDASVVLFSDEPNVLKLAVSYERRPELLIVATETEAVAPVRIPRRVGKAGNPMVMDDEYTIFVLDTHDFAINDSFIDVIKGTTINDGHTLALTFRSDENTFLKRAFYSLHDGSRLYPN